MKQPQRGRWAWLAALIGCVVLAAGCGPAAKPVGHADGGGAPAATPSTAPVGTSVQHLTVDGRTRSFRLYRPDATAVGATTPLVVMLHGGFGDSAQAEQSYGWDAAAASHHFVVAYPDGLSRAWNVRGGCCGAPGKQGVDDVRFITAMVAAISRELPVDPSRVYATGISNGGMMAYRLGCDSTLFAAIGPDSATLLGDCPSPAPVSVIHIHGTADHNIPYLGGQGSGVAKINGPPVPDVVARWRAVDHCAPPTTVDAPPVATAAASCLDGRAVELITITGAGHQWPGGAAKRLIQRLLGSDPPSTALDATDTMWAFFAAHPKPVAS